MRPITKHSPGTRVSTGERTSIASEACSRRSEILRALAQTSYTRAALLDLDLSCGRTTLFAWPQPAGRPLQILLDVVRVAGVVLDEPIMTGFKLETTEQRADAVQDASITITAEELEVALEERRPQVIAFGETEWHLVSNAGTQREVRELDRHGRPVFQDVDTSVYCYKLICPRCGRARYAKRNSIYEVNLCRVCTKQERLRNRALEEYRTRPRTGSRRRLAPHEVDRVVEMSLMGSTNAEAARALGVTESCISKVLKRCRRR